MSKWECENCPSERSACLTRPAPSEVAIVVDFPTERQARKDSWFSGTPGSLESILRETLKPHCDLDELYVTSALNCRPNHKKKAMLNKAMNSCRERLVDELREAGVKKVLSFGSVGFSALTSLDKVQAITKARGRWHEAYGMNVLATFPAGFVLSQSEYFRDVARDVEKFFTTNGREPYPDVELWIPETIEETEEAFEFLEESGQPVGIDLETYGLSPIAHDVLAAGFCVMLDGHDALVVILDEALCQKRRVWNLIAKLLASDQDKVFHNGKFDLQFIMEQLAERGIAYLPKAIHDTMLLSYAKDERPMGKYHSHGLENLARVYYDAPDYGIPMGKFLEEWAVASEYDKREMRRKMHLYLGLDTYYTTRLFPDLWNECLQEDERLLDLYEDLLIPGSLALAEVERHGLLVDQPMLEKAHAKLMRKAKRIHKRITDEVGIPDFNPNSPKQVKELVYDVLNLQADVAMEALKDEAESGRRVASREAKEGARSRGTYTDPQRLKESATAAPVLRMLARGYPEYEDLLEDICEYRNITKNAGAYIEGWLQRIDVDGRLRTSFNLHGTATGRLSSTGPNLQNVPPSSHTGIPIRSAVMAPRGKVIIGADYKQLEVRVAAQLSSDPAMFELFDSGRDVHGEISAAIYNKPPEEISQYMRMLGKIVLFGLLYGRSPDSVATGPEQEDIVQRGGRRQTPDEVRDFFENILADWAQYAEWRQDLRDGAYEDGEVVLPSGRKRRFDFIPRGDGGHVGRQGLNTPVQGTASDVTLDALVRLQPQLPAGASVILTVHDALYVECYKKDSKQVEKLMEDVMEHSSFFDNMPGQMSPNGNNVPLKADIKTGGRWDEEDDQLGSGVTRRRVKPERKVAT